MSKIFFIARKELGSYFSSPTAYIFLGTFLSINLFVFFWVETFFARNIADVRPLFTWMPVLMIFLVAALTMKMWSEERRMGTVEFLLTVPVKTLDLVLGKFLACMTLISIALLLTLFLPLTVSVIGELDWGPVFGAYLASLLLAGTYTSIGLYISSRGDNQIVSLITTSLVSGIFYLAGSELLVSFFGNHPGELLKMIGTGSRFESISRGVLDLRDIYYYFSIIGIFLTLNTYALENIKWSTASRSPHHRNKKILIFLVVANFIFANCLIQRANFSRADLTEGSIYTISKTTENMIEQLQEPLLIRGYFSDRTHPLLAPLVPQIRDTIREYGILSKGKIRAEFIDPAENSDLEAEANRKFGIKPVPFRFSDRYRAEVVNSYFNILIQYGDQYEVLGFNDLIEINPSGISDIDVKLRNLEYDITRSIKKVLYGFQSLEHLFLSLKQSVQFVGYVSQTALPEQLQKIQKNLVTVLEQFKKSGQGKFQFKFLDPTSNPSLAQEIEEKYGFQPMMLGLFSSQSFYFYMTIQQGDTVIPLALPENLEEESLKKSIEAALKRLAPGFIKTVGMVTPKSTPPMGRNPYQQMPQQSATFELLKMKLEENYATKKVEIDNGRVPEDVDILILLAPKELTKKQLFAVDQFLMKGGTVIISSSPYSISLGQRGIKAEKTESGLQEWLSGYGLTIQDNMVLDPQNENFPIAVNEQVGFFQVQKIKMVNYPYLADIRGDGLNRENGITSGIPEMTMHWASPIIVDMKKNSYRKTSELLFSSNKSWTSDSTNLTPNFNVNEESGFASDQEKKSHLLAISVEGKFESYFKGKVSPLLKKEEQESSENITTSVQEEEKPIFAGKIDKSTATSRIILFASNEFLKDQTLEISRSVGSSRFMNNLQLIENAIDWSVQDRGLLSIRSRGNFSRTLIPMTHESHMFWEYINYFLALMGLVIVFIIHKLFQRSSHKRLLQITI